jgi:hypothetical protein
MVWETIKENIKISSKVTVSLSEQKQHKPWFDDECSQFLGQRKRLKCSGCRIQIKVT